MSTRIGNSGPVNQPNNLPKGQQAPAPVNTSVSDKSSENILNEENSGSQKTRGVGSSKFAQNLQEARKIFSNIFKKIEILIAGAITGIVVAACKIAKQAVSLAFNIIAFTFKFLWSLIKSGKTERDEAGEKLGYFKKLGKHIKEDFESTFVEQWKSIGKDVKSTKKLLMTIGEVLQDDFSKYQEIEFQEQNALYNPRYMP